MKAKQTIGMPGLGQDEQSLIQSGHDPVQYAHRDGQRNEHQQTGQQPTTNRVHEDVLGVAPVVVTGVEVVVLEDGEEAEAEAAAGESPVLAEPAGTAGVPPTAASADFAAGSP